MRGCTTWFGWVSPIQGRLNSSGREKGVDVSGRLVEATHQQSYDVAIVVSQDSDLNPAVAMAKQLAQTQNRTVDFESAFPLLPDRRLFGIAGTSWIPIDRDAL